MIYSLLGCVELLISILSVLGGFWTCK